MCVVGFPSGGGYTKNTLNASTFQGIEQLSEGMVGGGEETWSTRDLTPKEMIAETVRYCEWLCVHSRVFMS